MQQNHLSSFEIVPCEGTFVGKGSGLGLYRGRSCTACGHLSVMDRVLEM